MLLKASPVSTGGVSLANATRSELPPSPLTAFVKVRGKGGLWVVGFDRSGELTTATVRRQLGLLALRECVRLTAVSERASESHNNSKAFCFRFFFLLSLQKKGTWFPCDVL